MDTYFLGPKRLKGSGGANPCECEADVVNESYFAVIFTSQRTSADGEGYEVAAARMIELAAAMPGYLGVESARGEGGLGITVSYWSSLEAIRAWREQTEHLAAQAGGREKWYQWFKLRVCRVERDYKFERPPESSGP